jgi:hypothetical protein
MKVPSNIIVKDQYTQGKEFIYSDTYENYQGYYYEMNSRYFIGRVFDPNAREILKLQSDKVDKLKLNSKLSIFINLLKTKIPSSIKIPSTLPDGMNSTRYFAKKLNYTTAFTTVSAKYNDQSVFQIPRVLVYHKTWLKNFVYLNYMNFLNFLLLHISD